MKHVLTLFLIACSCIVSAQSEYCLDGTVWDAALGGCVPEVLACGFDTDLDGDGAVGSSDLLALLTDYGFVVVDDDSDGVCDDIDECVGVYDECGICNGPGALFDCGCFPCPENCGVVSYQGYDYATVIIGDQCWFAENLRCETYLNGDTIPANLNNYDWANTTSGATAIYGEGESVCTSLSPTGDACDETWSLDEYGRLYNWYAVDDARGLCPSGWHVPTYQEFNALEDALYIAANYTSFVDDIQTTTGWISDIVFYVDTSDYVLADFVLTDNTNASGFSCLPGGQRTYNGSFFGAGTNGYFWSSSPYFWSDPIEYGSSAYVGNFWGFNTPSEASKTAGFSVRCLQDTE